MFRDQRTHPCMLFRAHAVRCSRHQFQVNKRTRGGKDRVRRWCGDHIRRGSFVNRKYSKKDNSRKKQDAVGSLHSFGLGRVKYEEDAYRTRNRWTRNKEQKNFEGDNVQFNTQFPSERILTIKRAIVAHWKFFHSNIRHSLHFIISCSLSSFPPDSQKNPPLETAGVTTKNTSHYQACFIGTELIGLFSFEKCIEGADLCLVIVAGLYLVVAVEIFNLRSAVV